MIYVFGQLKEKEGERKLKIRCFLQGKIEIWIEGWAYIGHHRDVEGGLCKLKRCIPVVYTVVVETRLIERDFGGGVFGDELVHG